MKSILLILALAVIAGKAGAANTKETELANAIVSFCQFYERGHENQLECGLFLTNCIIGADGEWTGNKVAQCMKKWLDNK